jgi:hypothetical protein
MVLQYDWKKISTAAKGRLGRIITIFNMITFNSKPLSKKDPKIFVYNKDFSGNSYMLNPKGLFKYRNSYTDREICQYIALAALRNYSEYVISGDKSLSLIKSPLSTEKIKANRLLDIREGKIYFMYEEVPKEK